MIEHSSSFKDKTKFSQEKYIKKKEKKSVMITNLSRCCVEVLPPPLHRYAPIFRIVKTTTLLLCELYFTQTPTKT
jgi:hypothetical protein